MRRYYDARLPEYDAVYAKPERQADLAALRQQLQRRAAGCAVLELACGTGYWTAVVAQTAASVAATDVSAQAIEVAGRRHFARAPRFAVADALQPASFVPLVPDGADLTLAMFWWSHVRRAALPAFVAGAARATRPGGRLLFADNRYVEGSSTPVDRIDADGDGWQQRRLGDGSTHAVLKNFPARAELERVLSAVAAEIEVVEYEYFWLAVGRRV